MKPTLLVLAAGMGSRYGKLKQMDAFGPNGETIIDYSLFDAINAGFGKVVFVIREYFKDEFIKYFQPKLEGRIDVAYVTQEIHNVPPGSTYRSDREKPWGTAHAIWVAKEVIHEPFGVINADDYYGVDSFFQLASFLKASVHTKVQDYAVIGYYLKNTLSDHGTVNRGICSVDFEKYLMDVKEVIKIKRDTDCFIKYPDDGDVKYLSEKAIVSMNMWGFLPSYFDHCTASFIRFLDQHGDELTSEFYIPALVDELIKNNVLKVKVLDTESDWFGVTYQEDKPYVMERIQELISKGVYPQNLWI